MYCGWCVGFGFRSLVVSSSVRDPRCWYLVCWCCFGCVGSACPACVALCCSALPCVRFVCSGRDELIVLATCSCQPSMVAMPNSRSVLCATARSSCTSLLHMHDAMARASSGRRTEAEMLRSYHQQAACSLCSGMQRNERSVCNGDLHSSLTVTRLPVYTHTIYEAIHRRLQSW